MGAKMKRILFVGNSFTFYNDLPAMLQQVAQAAGLDMETRMIAKGGWYLSRFANPQDEMGQELRKAYSGQKWDYVVLQDQSFNPVRNRQDLVQAARALRELMNAGEQMLMYQTWAYRADSEKLNGTGLSYWAMHDALKAAYQEAADAIGGICVPVGDAFGECYRTQPQLEMYCEDSFHPSPAGTYLAACMFYAAIAGESPLRLATPDSVDEADAQAVRAVADALWQRGK